MDSTENSPLALPAAPTQEDRLWAGAAHLAALLAAFVSSWFVGVAGTIAALVIWFIVRDRSAFAAAHAKEAFNFNLSMFIYACAGLLIALLLVGGTLFTLGFGLIVTAPLGLLMAVAYGVLAVAWLVLSILAAAKAWDGQPYRYPLTIRLWT